MSVSGGIGREYIMPVKSEKYGIGIRVEAERIY